MKKTMTFLFILLITMSIGLWAQTPFTATYTFGADGNVASFTYNGTTYAGISMGTIDKVGVTTSSSSGNFRATQWPLGATTGSDVFTGTVDTNKYIGFTMSAVSGYKFTVTIIDGNPDEMGISINDPSDNLFHDLGINEVVSSSDYTIVN